MKKKTLLALLSAVMVISSAAFGTIAYLTATSEPIVNTFTVGNVSIMVDETVVTPDGKPAQEDHITPLPDGVTPIRKPEGNEYRLRPGMEYTKDPTMTVKANSEESYVRMMVTLNKLDALKTIFGDDFLPQNYVAGWDNTVWPCVSATENGDQTVTYEFRYHEAVDTMDGADKVLEPLFESFTIPGELTGDQLNLLNGFEIKVFGQAIQTAGFADADAAWAAFPTDTASSNTENNTTTENNNTENNTTTENTNP